MKRKTESRFTDHQSLIPRANSSDEFARGASEWPDDISRREFLRLAGASLALAGFGACTKQPIEEIVPYVKQPEEIVPGKSLRFASATSFNGYSQGLVVTSREGRPIKIEGNPDHPASLGATAIWAQADLLDLYDPDRAQAVMHGENITTWNDFLSDIDAALLTQQSSGGAGIRILTEVITSPTLISQLQLVQQKFPNAKCIPWQPITHEAAGPEALYDLTKARVIVALDSDFLFMHPAALRYARDFSKARHVSDPASAVMNRLYVAEPTPTITGSNADHRIAAAARDVLGIAEQIAARVASPPRSSEVAKAKPQYESWIQAAANDLLANRGASIAIAGDTQTPEVRKLVADINRQLANEPIDPRKPVLASQSTNQIGDLRQLVQELDQGQVELLIIVGGNPIYNTPADIEFRSALRKAKTSVHHTLHANETSLLCHWVIPAAHFLETWSDVRAFDGAVSIVQPLIEPLYANVSTHEMIGALIERPVRSAYEIVREFWRARNQTAQFELDWRRALSDGIFAAEKSQPTPGPGSAEEIGNRKSEIENSLEVLFRPDPSVLDGRYTNNAWLQELPRPFTKLTWENAALISPQLAGQEKIDNGDVVELTFRGRKLKAPVWIQPGQAENSVTLHLGYGRTEVGRVGKDCGFNAYPLRTSDALWFGDGLTIKNTGEKHSFAMTQHHHTMEGRDFLRTGTLAEFLANPEAIARSGEEPADDDTLYDPNEYQNRGYAWGMIIDLGRCIGCSACTIACQAENNIPVVGKQQVALGREMHWIRVDMYHAGKVDDPQFNHQPVPCMHCEHAPCELVCPVGATVHDDEGINVQVYNRCIGTRYCSNNCPYKVRRFNFLELNAGLSATEKLVKNPDVTVRSRGVMEKCTYCTQRIEAARIQAELENRSIRDGEVVPACAQVCPTEAIVFGNIHDPNSRVSKLKRSPINYRMLAELNTRPRTTYLAKLRNSNERLVRSD